jgi:hypothetical protein
MVSATIEEAITMKHKSRRAILCALMITAVTVLTGANCVNKPTGSTGPASSFQPSGSAPTAPGSVGVLVHKWREVIPGPNFNPSGNAMHAVMAVSKGKSRLYVTANEGKELFKADLSGGFLEIFNDDNWAKIDLGSTKLGGIEAGKANLTTAKRVIDLVPTKKGVLVGRAVDRIKTDNSDNGVGYLEDDWKAAWDNGPTNMHTGAGGPKEPGVYMKPAVIEKANGDEYPVLIQTKGHVFGLSSDLATNFANVRLNSFYAMMATDGRPVDFIKAPYF